jgi:hypothetical protein
VRVSTPNLEEARKRFPGVDFVQYTPGAEGVNPHEMLAIGRVLAEIVAIKTIACKYPNNATEPQRVDMLFGAFRDLRLVGALNRALTDANHQPIAANLIGEQVMPEDAHRRNIAPAGPTAPYAILVNIYAMGEDNGPVMPHILAALGYEYLIWVGHRFNDVYGRLMTAHYVRTHDTVYWCADDVAGLYAPHNPCDAMHMTGASQGFQWHTLHTVTYKEGDSTLALYDIVAVEGQAAREMAPVMYKRTEQIAMEVEIPDTAPLFNYCSTRLPLIVQPMAVKALAKWLDFGAATLPKTRVLLNRADLAMGIRFISNKGRHQYSFRGLQTEIARVLADPVARPSFRYVEDRHPLLFTNYRWHVAIAAFVQDAHQHALNAAALRHQFGASFDLYNGSIRAIDTAPLSSSGFGLFTWAFLFAAGHVIAVRLPYVRTIYSALWRLLGRVFMQLMNIQAANGIPTFMRHVAAAAQRRLNRVLPIQNSNALQQRSSQLLDLFQRARTRTVENAGRAVGTMLAVRDIARRTSETIGEMIPQLAPETVEVFRAQPLVPLPPLPSFYETVVFAPIMEETAKWAVAKVNSRAWWATCFLFGTLDVFGPANQTQMAGQGLGVKLVTSVQMSLIHAMFGCLPLPIAVAAHSLRNWLAYNCVVGMRRGIEALRMVNNGGWWSAAVAALVGALCWWLKRRATPVVQPVELFDQRWYPVSPVPVQQPIMEEDPTEAIVTIPEKNRIVPAVTAHDLDLPVYDRTVEAVGPVSFYGEDGNYGAGYYRIYGHNAPMFRPAGSVSNIRAVVNRRLRVPIRFDAEHITWWQVHNLFSTMRAPAAVDNRPYITKFGQLDFDDFKLPTFAYELDAQLMQQLDMPELWATWLRHVEPDKKKRAVEAKNHAMMCPVDLHTPKLLAVLVNVKKDEVLLKYRMVEADLGFAPRPIHNVDPLIAVEVGPYIYAATEKLKKFWRWDFQHQHQDQLIYSPCIGLHVYVTFGAGLSSEDLDDWFAFAISHTGWHVLVAGDDSVAIGNDKGRLIIVEGDISKCDHSVRCDALRFEYAMLLALKVPLRIVELIAANSRATCVVAGKRIDGGSVKLKRGIERNTGGTDTTFGNTVVVAGPLAWACAYAPVEWNLPGVSQADAMKEWFQNCFARCGFELKARVTTGPVSELGLTLWPPSFLKGTWWPCAERWCWGPLVSRLLKVSKLMTDPRVVYHTADYQLAARRHMAAIYSSMDPHVWPSEIKLWLKTRADPAWSADIQVEEWHQEARPSARAGFVPVVDDRWYDQAGAWYGVPPEEMRRFVSHLLSVDVGTFSFHPMWVTMALRDYN